MTDSYHVDDELLSPNVEITEAISGELPFLSNNDLYVEFNAGVPNDNAVEMAQPLPPGDDEYVNDNMLHYENERQHLVEDPMMSDANDIGRIDYGGLEPVPSPEPVINNDHDYGQVPLAMPWNNGFDSQHRNINTPDRFPLQFSFIYILIPVQILLNHPFNAPPKKIFK